MVNQRHLSVGPPASLNVELHRVMMPERPPGRIFEGKDTDLTVMRVAASVALTLNVDTRPRRLTSSILTGDGSGMSMSNRFIWRFAQARSLQCEEQYCRSFLPVMGVLQIAQRRRGFIQGV